MSILLAYIKRYANCLAVVEGVFQLMENPHWGSSIDWIVQNLELEETQNCVNMPTQSCRVYSFWMKIYLQFCLCLYKHIHSLYFLWGEINCEIRRKSHWLIDMLWCGLNLKLKFEIEQNNDNDVRLTILEDSWSFLFIEFIRYISNI